MVRKVTKEILNKMIEMRKSGSTYSEITRELGVTKERCIAYLKNILPDENYISAVSIDWEVAEREAKTILEKMGFSHIVDLNDICSFPPHWDYYAEKQDRKWLIDVTINTQKSIYDKSTRCVDEYSHAILLKTDFEWQLIEIKTEIQETIKI